MSEHCCRMSSTTWFWNTMVMGMLVSSVSGRSSVGPNTMATLCTDMRFCSPCSITLQRGWGGVASGHRAGGGLGGSREGPPPGSRGSPAHRHRCWKSNRRVSWLGEGSDRTRSRTQRLRWAWSCSSGEGTDRRERESRLGQENRAGCLPVCMRGPGQGDAGESQLHPYSIRPTSPGTH